MEFETVVVGAGPAGSVAARVLAEGGLRTALVERATLPRYKTCGGGLTFRARSRLGVDLEPVIEREFAEVDLHVPDLHLRAVRPKPIITMVMRDALDAHLVDRARGAGAEILDGTAVAAVEQDAGSVTLQTSAGPVRAKMVIAADGALSPLAKMCGWEETRTLVPALEAELSVNDADWARLSPSARFDIGALPSGYAWCFPKRAHLSVGVVTTLRGAAALKKQYDAYLDALGVRERVKEERHGFQIPLSPRADGFARGRVIVVGDAAGLADPLTAEGISNAALSGREAARRVVEHRAELAATSAYEAYLTADLLPRLRVSRLLSRLLYGPRWLQSALFSRFGAEACEVLTDIFMGDRDYPTDARARLARYVKRWPAVAAFLR